jgi:hypothetical protein
MAEQHRIPAVVSAATCTPVPAGTEGETLTLVPKSGTETPTYVSEHVLFRKVTRLADLPTGTIHIRKDAYSFVSVQTDRIPMDKQVDLHQAVADGRVYDLWDVRRAEFEDLDASWPRQTNKRVALASLRRLRSNRGAGTTNTECDGD